MRRSGIGENKKVLAHRTRLTLALIAALLLAACASTAIAPEDCPQGTQKLAGCPPVGAIDDAEIARLYEFRSYRSPSELDDDPVEFGRDAEIPINRAHAKFIGSTDAGGLTSLAAKIHMIEQAEHTVDVMYYIFRHDMVGLALLGALCDAVERGVDVRIMFDSLGFLESQQEIHQGAAELRLERRLHAKCGWRTHDLQGSRAGQHLQRSVERLRQPQSPVARQAAGHRRFFSRENLQ